MSVIQAAHRFGNSVAAPALAVVPAPEIPEQGVDKLVQAFLKSRRMAATAESYRKDIVAYLTHLAERDRSFFSATREDVDDWRLSMEAAGLSESTRARRLAGVSGLYTYGLIDWTGLPHVYSNPAKDVKRPNVTVNTQYLGLAVEQTRRLLQAVREPAFRLQDRNWVRTSAIASVLTHTGVRRNELAQADVSSLGTERGHRVLHVVRKGGAKQAIVIAPTGAQAVDLYLDGRTSGPLLLSEEGKRLDGSAVYRAIQRLGAYAVPELERSLHPHDLRHGCATLLYELGASDWEVQTILGHADVRTTRRYNHARVAMDGSPLYKLGEALAIGES